ncbi:GINS complex, PSF2 component [Hesseltinella vesiculosa]|uniref:DNA replication complex GINS protein PSF2 n=1 Tax=Hesseltinella vesiculosa TaxID=101127 RepID=A0A1X2G230_9FUNG|nr:GINS complex, PSF2 component [Hesseltinella vesiculosa]
MALPRSHQPAFTPAEIEFIAGNDPISVIPLYKMPAIKLIQATYGPFRPPLPTRVPLWLALSMKKNQKCKLLPPPWLTVDHLTERLEQEETKDEFCALPFHYMEMAHMILESASDDIPNAEKIRKLLKDLRETRQSKARVGLEALDDRWLGMHNLSFMEINEIRPFFSKAFNEMRKLEF